MSEGLRLGMIGAGGMARSLATAAAELDDCKVVCVQDPLSDPAQQLAAELGADSCQQLEELLSRSDVDAVVVAAPNYLHKELTVAAAGAGKHIFCEKPMALSAADAQQMIAAAREAGVKLMIGQVLRYVPPFAWIKDFIDADNLGEPFAMQTTRISGPWHGHYAQSWRMQREKCGGPLFEISAHEIDYMRQLLGEARSVYAHLGQFTYFEVDYEDLAYVMVNFEDNKVGCLLAGFASHMGAYDGKILCTDGTLFFTDFGGGVSYQRRGEEEPTTLTGDEVGEGYEPGVRREMREFVEAVLNDTEPTIPGEEGLRNTEIAEAAHISGEQGQPVSLPLSGTESRRRAKAAMATARGQG